MVDYTSASGNMTDGSGRRQYVDRNDASGVQGTYLIADDRNMDRNELVNAVLGSGQVLDGTNHAQLVLAIQALGNIRPYSKALSDAIGGYWLGAIVVDSRGAYWKSTVAANTTVPGADGASWSSLFDGLATQAWANDQFATIAKLESESSTRSSDDVSLSEAIQSETEARTTADEGLQTAITTEARARATAVAGRVQGVNFIRFNASGTYAASSNLLFAKIVAKGGGGGAGGMVGNGSGRASGGGGEGATSTAWYTAAQVRTSNGQVVVGAGGAGGVGAASGGVGGMSYVLGLHQAAGGQPSQGLSSGPLGTHGGAGGYASSTGSAIVAGAPGGGGISYNTAYLCAGSGGGNGGGYGTGVSGTTYADGVNGVDNSGGGGGGCVSINGTATGGAGGSGYVEITEYIGG